MAWCHLLQFDQPMTSSIERVSTNTRCPSRTLISGMLKGTLSETMSSRFFFSRWRGPRHDHCEKSVSDEGQCYVPVPGNPLPDLIMIEPDLALGRFEARLDGPAEAGAPHHVLQRRRPGREHQEQGDVIPVCQRAPNQQRMVACLGSRHDQCTCNPSQSGPVVVSSKWAIP